MASKKGPEVPVWAAAAAVSLALGAVAGYGAAHWQEKPPPSQMNPGGGGGGGAPGGGGGGGGFGGGGGGANREHTNAVVRYVRSLAVLERYREAALTPEQKAKLAAALQAVSEGSTLTEEQAEKIEGEIDGVLNDEQKQILDDLRPRRGGGGGGGFGGGGGGFGGGGGRGGPGAANVPGSAPANVPGGNASGAISGTGAAGPGGAGGPGGGGGQPDPDRPFADGANKDRLAELKAALGK